MVDAYNRVVRTAPVVIRDNKRKRLGEIAEFLRRSGVPVVRKADAFTDIVIQPVGEYHGYAIDILRPERYSIAKRFAEKKASEAGDKKLVYVVLFEGWYGRLDIRDWNATLRAIQSLDARVVVSPNKAWTHLYILAKAKKVAEGRPRPHSLRPGPPRDATPEERAYYLLTAFGTKTAHALLKHFGSIEKLCEASPEELSEVRIGDRRLGKKRAELIYHVLHANYNEL